VGPYTGPTPTDRSKLGSKRHIVTDAQGIPVMFCVTGANRHDSVVFEELVDALPAVGGQRGQPRRWPGKLHAYTGHTVQLAWADQGYTGDAASKAAQDNGIDLHIVKLPEAKKGFVLLPRRWVVERSFGWLARFRRLSRDYERLPEVLGGLHFLAFAVLMLPAAARILVGAGSS